MSLGSQLKKIVYLQQIRKACALVVAEAHYVLALSNEWVLEGSAESDKATARKAS